MKISLDITLKSDIAMRKHCPGCGQELLLSEFTHDKRRRDGLSFYCKICARLRLRRSQDAKRGGPPTISLKFVGRFDTQDKLDWLSAKRLAGWLRNAATAAGSTPPSCPPG